MRAVQNGAESDGGEITGIDELLDGKPIAVNDLSMLPKSREIGVGEIAGIDVFSGGEPRPGNALSMSVKMETGCDDDPEFPIVAPFVRTGHAIDETLDIDALRAVWHTTTRP